MPVFTVPIHEANDCHLPAGTPAGGQFCSKSGSPGRNPKGSRRAILGLKQAFKTTDKPEETRFLLPDGTRISWNRITPDPYNNPTTHTEIAKYLGLSLNRVLQSGVIRYVPFEGFDTQSKITDAQAEVIANDFIVWRKSIYADARSGSEAQHKLKLFDWRDVTPSLLRAWVNARVAEK